MNPVLDEAGPLSSSRPVTLVHYAGARTETRGTFAELDETAAELMGAFSESGPNCWVPTPANRTEVEFVIIDGVTWRALDQERLLAGFDTTRFQLLPTIDPPLPPLVVPGDFSGLDFDFRDFNTDASP